jgi:hypothetical protein
VDFVGCEQHGNSGVLPRGSCIAGGCNSIFSRIDSRPLSNFSLGFGLTFISRPFPGVGPFELWLKADLDPFPLGGVMIWLLRGIVSVCHDNL